jgi:hypothetical protein
MGAVPAVAAKHAIFAMLAVPSHGKDLVSGELAEGGTNGSDQDGQNAAARGGGQGAKERVEAVLVHGFSPT